MKNNTYTAVAGFFALLMGIAQYSVAQDVGGAMSLQQCIQYGLVNNKGIMKSKLDIERTNAVRQEAVSGYYPQVNGSGNLNDNLKLQTSILPGEFFGQPGTQIPVKFGTKYNVVAGVDASQIIFNQSILYAVKAAKENTKLAELSVQKNINQLTYDIAAAYYAAQVTFTQQQLLRNNLQQVDTLLHLTQIQLDNGFARQLDVDRLKVSQSNLETDLSNVVINYEQQLAMLKYMMGMPNDQSVTLPEISVNGLKVSASNNEESLDMTDVQLLQSQRNLYALNIRQLKGSHLPTLSLNYRYAYQFQQDDLRMFTKNANWFPNSYLGLNLNVPIFDGFAIRSKAKQVQIQSDQNKLDEEMLRSSLVMQRVNAQSKLKSNTASLSSQLRNIDLAQSIFEATRVQYTGGIASMSDLINAETGLADAQTNYLRSLIQVKLAELELLKISGSLSSILK